MFFHIYFKQILRKYSAGNLELEAFSKSNKQHNHINLQFLQILYLMLLHFHKQDIGDYFKTQFIKSVDFFRSLSAIRTRYLLSSMNAKTMFTFWLCCCFPTYSFPKGLYKRVCRRDDFVSDVAFKNWLPTCTS